MALLKAPSMYRKSSRSIQLFNFYQNPSIYWVCPASYFISYQFYFFYSKKNCVHYSPAYKGQSLPGILAAYASVKRIQEFLTLDEKDITASTKALAEKGNSSNQSSNPPASISLHGSFSWDKGSSLVLKDIDLDLPTDKLTISVGPVASVSNSPTPFPFILALYL